MSALNSQSYVAWLTINRSCNLRCEWCYAQGINFPKNDMSMDIANKAINIFKSLPMKTVFLIGGEPTLHPNFFEIVRLISSAGLTPNLITNSIAFRDKKFLEKSLEAGILGINTSLKGVNIEQYKKNTGRDSFSDVIMAMRNIENIRSTTSLYHRVSITMSRDFFDNINELIMVMKNCGIGEFSIDTERPIFVNNLPQPVRDMTPKDTVDFLLAVHPILKKSGIKFSIKISLPFCLFPSDFIGELRERGELLSGCQLISGSGLIIDSNGNLLPCNHFCENKLGSIDIDFSTGEEYLKFRNRQDVFEFYRAIGSCPNQKCQGCEEWSACGGGCRLHWFCGGADSLMSQ